VTETSGLRIAIAQLNPKIGDFAGNTTRILAGMARAREAGAGLVVFPELSIPGYFPRDLLDSDAFLKANEASLSQVAAAATGIAAICGFVERNRGPGRPFYNATALLRGGRVEAVYRKHLLPYYDVFEEERYFEPGDRPLFFEIGGTRLALAVCEDVWNFPQFVARPYREQPLEALRGHRLDWVISPSASPFHLGKPAQRRSVLKNAAQFVGASFVLCNQVGGNDDLIFDGGSFAVTPDGREIARAAYFAEDLVILGGAPAAASADPGSEPEWIARALAMGTADYVRKNGFSRVCLGLSGGIDSSVVAGIAAGALGPANVAAVALPTRFTASASNEDARQLAQALGIDFRLQPIEPLFLAFESALPGLLGKTVSSLTRENVQPRIRMTLLMALANQENRLLLNTSNKSEIATGYSTLYGDGAGALSVIGDLTKAQVYELARHLNRDGSLIPPRVLTRPPTAELRENQTDQDSLPPYDRLDPIVQQAIEMSRDPAALKQSGQDPAAVDRFARLYAASEYKRQQFPPILRISPRAFGRGRRIPLAANRP
jgi:NAD+ synthetase